MTDLYDMEQAQRIQTILEALREKRLDDFRSLFLALHPIDRQHVFEQLTQEERQPIYEVLAPEEFADVFANLDRIDQKQVVIEMDEAYMAKVLEGMYSDEIADFLSGLSEAQQYTILRRMSDPQATNVRELLSYPDESAGAMMTKEYISIRRSQTVQEVINSLRRRDTEAETIYYLYVAEESHELVGVLSLRELIVAPPDVLVETIMNTAPISTTVTTDREDAAAQIQQYDLLALPVVTHDGTLVGIITVDDVIDVIEEELTEDVGELSASRGATDIHLSPFQAAKKRGPWIVLLMFLGLITANVIGQFEETLEAVVLLSVFIPLIMDSAGNTGTQSLAVIVRGLATGSIEKKGMGKMLRRELGTGMLMGASCAIVLMALVTLIYGHMVLAVIVGLSIFFTLSLSAVIGTIFPLLIHKLNIDPAVASGPFITTLNDIIGLLIYFSIATTFLQYL